MKKIYKNFQLKISSQINDLKYSNKLKNISNKLLKSHINFLNKNTFIINFLNESEMLLTFRFQFISKMFDPKSQIFMFLLGLSNMPKIIFFKNHGPKCGPRWVNVGQK